MSSRHSVSRKAVPLLPNLHTKSKGAYEGSTITVIHYFTLLHLPHLVWCLLVFHYNGLSGWVNRSWSSGMHEPKGFTINSDVSVTDSCLHHWWRWLWSYCAIVMGYFPRTSVWKSLRYTFTSQHRLTVLSGTTEQTVIALVVFSICVKCLGWLILTCWAGILWDLAWRNDWIP